jgi:hypothetical protein
LFNKDENYFSPSLFEPVVVETLTPISWWNTANSDNSDKIPKKFVEFCSKILTQPSSTAGLERSFSTMSNTITDKRNRLNVDTARKVSFINQALRKNLDKLSNN